MVVKKLLREGMVPAMAWRVRAVGLAPTERLKLRRQMAAAAGKTLSTGQKESGPEKWPHEQKDAWMKQVREVQMWRQVRGPAGAVMCETRDLCIKWPHWDILMTKQSSVPDAEQWSSRSLWTWSPSLRSSWWYSSSSQTWRQSQ